MALAPFFSRGSRNDSVWDPFSWPTGIFDPSESFSVFDRPFGREAGAVIGTKVDWMETPEAHVFKADLPGLKKEEIKVEVRDGRTLSITGERSKEKSQATDNWRCVERSYGKFSRQFGLPENAKVEEVAAKVENGVLTVTVPKSKAEIPRVQSINVA